MKFLFSLASNNMDDNPFASDRRPIGKIFVARPFSRPGTEEFFFRRPVTASHYFLLVEKRRKTLKRVHEKFQRNTYSFTTGVQKGYLVISS